MTEPLPPAPASHRRMWPVYAAALLLLAAAFFVAEVAIPFWRVRGVVKALAANKEPTDAELDPAIKSLGGARKAAELAAGYLRWPDFLAPDKKTAQILLSACGDDALGPASGLLRGALASRRIVGARALAGYEFYDHRKSEHRRLGPDPQRAAQALASALGEPGGPVHLAICRALEKTGPPRLMPLDAFRKHLAAAGWRFDKSLELPPYRVTTCSRFDDDDGPRARAIFSKNCQGKHLIVGEWVGQDAGGLNSADLTGDGQAEVYFNDDSRGSDWRCRPLYVFELGDEPREITPQTEGVPMEISGTSVSVWDGTFEGYLAQNGLAQYGDVENRLVFERTCAWDARRGKFVDITASLTKEEELEKFDLELELVADRSFKEWACQAVNGLMGYWLVDRTPEGWRKFSAHIAKVKPRLSEIDRKLIEKMEADLRRRLGITAP